MINHLKQTDMRRIELSQQDVDYVFERWAVRYRDFPDPFPLFMLCSYYDTGDFIAFKAEDFECHTNFKWNGNSEEAVFFEFTPKNKAFQDALTKHQVPQFDLTHEFLQQVALKAFKII